MLILPEKIFPARGKYLYDIEKDSFKRVNGVKKEIKEILKRSKICSKITKELDERNIPYRVTHNDTKVNNVLMKEGVLWIHIVF